MENESRSWIGQDGSKLVFSNPAGGRVIGQPFEVAEVVPEKWAALRGALREFVDATFAAMRSSDPAVREAIDRAHVFAVWRMANDPSFPLPLRRLQ